MLDPTFGDGGKVLTNIGTQPAVNEAYDVVAYQSDGKAVMVGTTSYDIVVVRYNSDGTLDTTFGTDGEVKIDFGDTYDFGYAVEVDSADHVLVGGYSNQGTLLGIDFAVARLTPSGVLDTTFGDGGKQMIDFGGRDSYARSVAVDSADRVLLGGYSGGDFAVARLTTSGQLDSSFGSGGKQTVDFGSTYDYGYGVAVDSAGRVLLGGDSNQGTPTGYDFAVTRLTPSGALDTTFGSGGKQTVDFGNTYDRVYGVAVDSADRVLLGGHSNQGTPTGYDFAVARLTTSGALDTSFSSDGKQTVDFGNTYDRACGVAVDGANHVLLGGYSSQGSPTYNDFAVARLTSTGVLDSAFGSSGKRTIDFGNTSDIGYGVAVDASGRVLVGGYSDQPTTRRDFAVARLTTLGTLDTDFNGNGKVITDICVESGDYGRDVIAYQDDGKLVVVGTTYNGSVVVRYNADGTLDTTFGSDGKVVIADLGGAHSVAVDDADRILVAGSSAGDFAVVRLTESGSLDTAFGDAGKQTIDFGGTPDQAFSVAVDNAGRVMVGGHSVQSGTGNDFAVARLTGSGAIDTTFGSGGKQTIDFGNTSDDLRSVAVDSAGRILLGGSINPNLSGQDFGVARLTASGTLDTTFGVGGRQRIDFGDDDYWERCDGMAVDDADRVLLAGTTYQQEGSWTQVMAAARLTTSGVLDTDFGDGGQCTVDFSYLGRGMSVAQDSAGRILLGGYGYGDSGTLDFAVARLTGDGALDGDFGDGGKQTVDFGGSNDVGWSGCALDSAGHIVLAGSSNKEGSYDIAVARLVSDSPNEAPSLVGIPDVTFAEDGSDSSIDLDDYYSDVETLPADATFEVTSSFAGVTASIDPDTHVLTITGDTDFNGDGLITIQVTDAGDGSSAPLSAQDTLYVAVLPVNDPPVVVAPIGDVTVNEDAADTVIDISGVFDDVDIATNGDSLSFAVVNDNGGLVSASLVGTTLTLDYLPDQNGTANITVTATDTQGPASISDTFVVTVTPVNDAPTVEANNVTVTVDEGDTAGNSGTFDDVDLTDTVTITASVGSISQDAGNSGAWTWVFDTSDGPEESQEVNVTATDGDLAAATIKFDLKLNNVAPTLAISGDPSVSEGSLYTLNLSSSDPGDDTISGWEINWGDGEIQTVIGNPPSVPHTYADGTRQYTILATATDEDGTYDAEATGANAIVALDPTFGDGGTVTADFIASTADTIRDVMTTQPDGKILVAGQITGGNNNIGLARYNADGTLDDGERGRHNAGRQFWQRRHGGYRVRRQ